MAEPVQQKFLTVAAGLVLASVCFLALAAGHHYTRDRIAANQRAAQLQLVSEVMPLRHDNDLLSDHTEISDGNPFSDGLPVYVYRAREHGKPAGLVFMPVRARGYNGLIELVVGIAYDGELTGVRVYRQHETVGLGDRIDQANSNWIYGFDGHSLQNTPATAWGVKGDGGEFDSLSGATISPRGVIKAVKNVLDYYAINKDQLYK